MQRLYIEPTSISPEIDLSPGENKFIIRGNSSPEDVRALYYPVIEWIKIFIDDVIEGEYKSFTPENPLKFQVELSYFNSSSAKFLYDIFTELKRLAVHKVPIVVEWCYDPEDSDQKEAGEDIALLVEMELTFVPKHP